MTLNADTSTPAGFVRLHRFEIGYIAASIIGSTGDLRHPSVDEFGDEVSW